MQNISTNHQKEKTRLKTLKITFTVMVLGFVLTMGLLACSKSAPACNDSRTKNLVIKISSDELSKQLTSTYGEDDASKMVKGLTMTVDTVRTTNKNEKVGSFECAANLVVKGPQGTKDFPITYTSELTDDGKSFYVSVLGLQ